MEAQQGQMVTIDAQHLSRQLQQKHTRPAAVSHLAEVLRDGGQDKNHPLIHCVALERGCVLQLVGCLAEGERTAEEAAYTLSAMASSAPTSCLLALADDACIRPMLLACTSTSTTVATQALQALTSIAIRLSGCCSSLPASLVSMISSQQGSAAPDLLMAKTAAVICLALAQPEHLLLHAQHLGALALHGLGVDSSDCCRQQAAAALLRVACTDGGRLQLASMSAPAIQGIMFAMCMDEWDVTLTLARVVERLAQVPAGQAALQPHITLLLLLLQQPCSRRLSSAAQRMLHMARGVQLLARGSAEARLAMARQVHVLCDMLRLPCDSILHMEVVYNVSLALEAVATVGEGASLVPHVDLLLAAAAHRGTLQCMRRPLLAALLRVVRPAAGAVAMLAGGRLPLLLQMAGEQLDTPLGPVAVKALHRVARAAMAAGGESASRLLECLQADAVWGIRLQVRAMYTPATSVRAFSTLMEVCLHRRGAIAVAPYVSLIRQAAFSVLKATLGPRAATAIPLCLDGMEAIVQHELEALRQHLVAVSLAMQLELLRLAGSMGSTGTGRLSHSSLECLVRACDLHAALQAQLEDARTQRVMM